MSLKERYGLDEPKFENFRVYEDSEGVHLFWEEEEKEKVESFAEGVKPVEVQKTAEAYLKKQK